MGNECAFCIPAGPEVCLRCPDRPTEDRMASIERIDRESEASFIEQMGRYNKAMDKYEKGVID